MNQTAPRLISVTLSPVDALPSDLEKGMGEPQGSYSKGKCWEIVLKFMEKSHHSTHFPLLEKPSHSPASKPSELRPGDFGLRFSCISLWICYRVLPISPGPGLSPVPD